MPSLKNNLKHFASATKWNFTNTLQKVKDTTNFNIEKTGRFSARFFQIFLAFFAYYFLGNQKKTLVDKYGLGDTNSWMLFFSIMSPIVSGFLIAMYLFPWVSRKWTSRRLLSVETFFDVFMTLGWISGFIALLAKIQGGCVSYQEGCDVFNWLVAWLFFLFVSWAAGLFFDITAWHRGVWSSDEIDSDVLLDIRRTTRAPSARR